MLQHMAWANGQVLAKVAELPDEALGAYVANPAWTVGEIVNHIVRSANFLGYSLQASSVEAIETTKNSRAKYKETESELKATKDITKLIENLKAADAFLIAESEKPEGKVFREVNGKVVERSRSTIIFQAVHHATEHRAQLVAALDAKGYGSINLDEYDLWAYSDKFGE